MITQPFEPPLEELVAQFYTAAADFDPVHTYTRLRTEEPLHKSAFGFWVVSRYEDAANLLNGTQSERTAPPLSSPGSAVQMLNQHFLTRLNGAEHLRLRRVVRGAFSPRAIRQYSELIRQAVIDCLMSSPGSGTLDLVKDVATPLPAAIFNELFAVPAADRPELAQWLEGIALATTPVGAPEGAAQAAEESAQGLTGYLTALIAERREAPGDDLLSALIQAQVDGSSCTNEELVSLLAQLFQAGTQTTEVLLTQGVLTLLRHPEQLDRLRSEPELTNTAVEECLRYSSPIRAMAQRVAVQDITIDGRVLPAGEQLSICVGAANRDPSVFAHPDEFDITRAPNPHLAFSTGAHFCLGAHLARLEARIALVTLLEQMPTLEVRESEISYGDSALRPKLLALPVN